MALRNPSVRPIRGRHGFTLVELMVVVAVIGLLTAIAVPLYTKGPFMASTPNPPAGWTTYGYTSTAGGRLRGLDHR